jgi:hypothetical protein
MPTKAPQTADKAPKNIMPMHQKEIPHPTPQKILHSLLFVIFLPSLHYYNNILDATFFNHHIGRPEKLVETNWAIKKKPTISVGAWDLEGRFLL